MTDPAGTLNLSYLADLAEKAARQAGALLRSSHGLTRSHVSIKSSATDLVSEMDTASEELIRSILLGARPGDAMLGEESGEQPGDGGHPTSGSGPAASAGVRWIVDPLDGTTNYLYGFPAWSVSIAARIGDMTVTGVVFDPDRDELFRAIRGGGAHMNGRPLAVRTEGTLATALVGTGFGYDAAGRTRQGRLLGDVLGNIRDIRRAGSAALDLCSVAAGRLDAYYEQGTQLWDWAAGALVAAEAGAWVGGFDGGRPSTDGIIAASPHLAAPLRSLLRDATAASVRQDSAERPDC